MAASSVAAMIGTDAVSTMAAAEGKAAGRGKSFADSLDAQIAAHIAADADVELPKAATEMGAVQTQDESQMLMNQARKGDVAGSAVLTGDFHGADIAAQISTASKISGLASPLAGNSQSWTAVINAQDLKRTETLSSVVAPQVEQAQMPDGQTDSVVANAVTAVIGKTSTEVSCAAAGEAKCVSDEQLQPGKLQSRSNASQSSNMSENVSSPFNETATVEIMQRQEVVSTGMQRHASVGGAEGIVSTNESGKKRDSAKADASIKTSDATANVTSAAIGTAAPVACGVAIPSPTAACSTTDSKTVGATLAVSKSAAPVAVSSAGGQSVKQPAGAVQQSSTQHNEKPADNKPGAAGNSGVNVRGMQKNAQADGMPVSQSAGQVARQIAKLQSIDVTAPALHAAGSSTTVMGASPGGVALQASMIGGQKSVAGDVLASSTAHGNGELSSAAGSQSLAMGETHKTLVATPTVLEVGIPNGTQGWLKVRAELANGGINASLAAASPGGQEMLHRELPALTAFLQQEKVAVSSLVVQSPVTGGFRDASGGAGGFAGGQAQQQNQGRAGSAGAAFTEGGVHPDLNMQTDEVLTAMQYPSGGSWLSVRA